MKKVKKVLILSGLLLDTEDEFLQCKAREYIKDAMRIGLEPVVVLFTMPKDSLYMTHQQILDVHFRQNLMVLDECDGVFLCDAYNGSRVAAKVLQEAKRQGKEIYDKNSSASNRNQKEVCDGKDWEGMVDISRRCLLAFLISIVLAYYIFT